MTSGVDGIAVQRLRNWVASLRDFIKEGEPGAERCELCNAEIGRGHAHLIEPETLRLLCACGACAVLFASGGGKRYRRVPGEVTRLNDFKLSDLQWDAFLIPIQLAFFYHSSAEGRVRAVYPGSAGAVESALDLEAWNDLAEANPVLRQLEEDVEALLVNRIADTRSYFRVPIDRCYELVGLIRSQWRGLSGGDGVREAIQTFFTRLNGETTNWKGATDA